MLTITPATDALLPIIRAIAYRTWPDTFGAILSPEQIDYMLEMMYSLDALRAQVNERGHIFLMAAEADSDVYWGYVSYELNYKGYPTTKIHKIYILPESQGKGVGYALINAVTDAARQHGQTALSLNVNKHNKAIHFYERQGFSIAETETIDIGNGYVMDDLIMIKPLFL